ncbi:MAG: hypothetical protein FWB80_10105 [Defluviitaleaceae bacterium]|nr:hypothetical protein [Defluviitaleaceae bacterium]
MLTQWLMENAAPVIRYRTQVELMGVSDKAVLQETMTDLLAVPQTQKRLALLRNLDYKRVHGSDNTNLENVLPMLVDFGLDYESKVFKREVKPNIHYDKPHDDFHYDKVISTPFLLQAKFPINGLADFAIERINIIYDFTQHMDFAIYDDIKNYPGVPKPFQDRPLIKPELANGTVCKLPMIYDVVSMAEVYTRVSADIRAKIDNIISYVISPEYDIVVPMYGILRSEHRKYYAMGWDCKKPFNDNHGYEYPNLHRLLLYSRFPVAVKSKWFQNAIDFLMQYKTIDGTFIFPKDYLMEKDGNWILGTHMSLGENRRKKQWSRVESTFYMLKLLNCIQ